MLHIVEELADEFPITLVETPFSVDHFETANSCSFTTIMRSSEPGLIQRHHLEGKPRTDSGR